MSISKPTKKIFWISFIVGLFAIANNYFLKIDMPFIGHLPNMAILTGAFILLVLGVVIRKL